MFGQSLFGYYKIFLFAKRKKACIAFAYTKALKSYAFAPANMDFTVEVFNMMIMHISCELLSTVTGLTCSHAMSSQ